jgi:hypothetical protein
MGYGWDALLMKVTLKLLNKYSKYNVRGNFYNISFEVNQNAM